jgi:hypothetical protein
MRVTYGHLKPIVKGSGPYHEMQWNVENPPAEQSVSGVVPLYTWTIGRLSPITRLINDPGLFCLLRKGRCCF